METVPEIVVICCGRALTEGAYLPEGWTSEADFKARFIRIPCSSKIEHLHMVKLFERGADAVLVVACAKDRCQMLFGSTGTEQRIRYTRQLLTEIGLEPARLSLASKADLSADDLIAIARDFAASVRSLGANPLKKSLAGAH